MKSEGFMPRSRYPDKDWRIPVSRDYKLVIPCQQTQCPINQSNYCSMASAIKINSGGRCQTGVDLIQEKTKMDKEKKKPSTSFYKHEGD